MSKTTVWMVLRKRLVFKPNRIQMVQQLSDEDHRHRLDFCLQLQDLMSSVDHFLEKVQFSDEATFDVSGAVNLRSAQWARIPKKLAKIQSSTCSLFITFLCAKTSHIGMWVFRCPYSDTAVSEYGHLKTHLPTWSINVTLLKSMCFEQSPVKKCMVHSSLLKKSLLARHIWTCCNCG